MLALIAFVPVAVELRFENIDLFMALAIVLGLGRWPWAFAIMAVIKLSPGSAWCTSLSAVAGSKPRLPQRSGSRSSA